MRVSLLVLFGVAGAIGAAAETDLDGFFRLAPDAAAGLAEDGVYPQGRRFPFALFSVGGSVATAAERDAAIARVKSDGFSMIGPQYELNDRVVEDAEEHGLKAVYTVGLPMDFLSDKPLDLTPDEIREQIGEQVDAVASSPVIAWWYLQPEELRYWRANEMAYLDAASEAIREADPQRRPIWMYDPGHRTAEGLRPTATRLDVCGKGLYTNYSGRRDARVWVRWSIEQEVEAIAQANPGAVPIAVPEMFEQPEADHVAWVPAWVRHDMYAALIAGAKGAVVFSMRRRDGFTAHDRYYQSYAQVAREVSGEGGLGAVFLFGERRDDLSVRVVEGPATLALAFGKGDALHVEQYASVSFLDVAYGLDRYLFAVNSSYGHVRAVVSGLPAGPIATRDVLGGAETATVEGGRFELRFEPLGVHGLRFSRP